MNIITAIIIIIIITVITLQCRSAFYSVIERLSLPISGGVNATRDASPAIFGQPGMEYLISPIVVIIIVNSVLTVHIGPNC